MYRDYAPRAFTMEGMLFDLDIITLSSEGQVTGIQTRSAGEGARETAPARYVLEVASGWAAAHGVVPGTTYELARIGDGVSGP